MPTYITTRNNAPRLPTFHHVLHTHLPHGGYGFVAAHSLYTQVPNQHHHHDQCWQYLDIHNTNGSENTSISELFLFPPRSRSCSRSRPLTSPGTTYSSKEVLYPMPILIINKPDPKPVRECVGFTGNSWLGGFVLGVDELYVHISRNSKLRCCLIKCFRCVVACKGM